jgi:hypothetical protein
MDGRVKPGQGVRGLAGISAGRTGMLPIGLFEDRVSQHVRDPRQRNLALIDHVLRVLREHEGLA